MCLTYREFACWDLVALVLIKVFRLSRDALLRIRTT